MGLLILTSMYKHKLIMMNKKLLTQNRGHSVHAHAAAVTAAKEAEVAQLRECAVDLWMMLDDIDTGGDRAKTDDVLYRAIAERTHRRRFSPKYQVVIDAIDAARKDMT